MTDNDIIKALECCKDRRCDICVRQCNHFADESICRLDLIEHVLYLINRQKAQIERLKKEIENLESIQEITPEAKHFVDTKADKVISLLNEAIKSQEQIKAEAIKGFAERLKKECIGDGWFEIEDELLCEMIDNLVKEMTEGKDESVVG